MSIRKRFIDCSLVCEGQRCRRLGGRMRQGSSLYPLLAVGLFYFKAMECSRRVFKRGKNNLICVVKFHTDCCVENGL